MRGMIKWKPFNTLLKSSDIKSLEKEMLLTNKPIIMEDRINDINYNLINAINNDKCVSIKYFNKGMLFYEVGKITNIKKQEKYILINNKRIYFKNIINVNIIN